MEQLLTQLDLNLKELYRKALDADAILDELQNKGQARHQAVFPAPSIFKISSPRFMPYLSETAEQIAAIRLTQQFNTATLALVVKQLQLLHKTLSEFRAVVAK
ncbi:MAG: prephenate dehydrogenase [Gammaproteobacteria bacterium]|jgi:predicted ATPase with chaperone activity|nr:prephenate dehydrogenase [Gammaproteobacteria bacterium]MBU2179104.1 prephenate dehydrogenase [Gammaproteobacteria bacterium]MBU2224610.1 prephenate dehydrogenase [Gammaproteobacteria bacterium]MBU2277709.1 prephenate dehydrogenase [Gammaproteobacteria bacterium]MBU2427572.1 prephenate dehydrogenase [Gammaproteobacteria bacterium]